MEEIKTHESDLVFEVKMAPQDHEVIVARMSEFLGRIITAGTIFFLSLCVIMSFVIWFLFGIISQGNAVIAQGNSVILTLKEEAKDLNSIISTQKRNGAKLNTLSIKVPALIKKEK